MTETPTAAWLAQATPEAAAHLRDLAEATEDKETRKAARRALYLLSQKGVVPSPRSAPTPPAAPSAPPPIQAWTTTVDGAGNRILFLALPDPDGGSPTLVQFLLSDEEAIKDFNVTRMARRELESTVNRFSEQLSGGVGMAPLEADYARSLIAQARELNREIRRPLPPGLLDFLPRFGSAQQTQHEPPIYRHLSADDVQADETLSHDAVAFFALPWFEPWFLVAEELYPYIEQSAAEIRALRSVGADEIVQKTAFANIISTATTELLPPQRRARYARRLEETAFVLWNGGEQAAAKQAVFHALELKSDTPVDDIEFAVLLVSRTLQVAMQMVKANGAGSSTLHDDNVMGEAGTGL